MSAYRYVVFPRGKQPAADEVREFQAFAGALANQFAYGTSRDDGRLAVAVDGRSFDHLLASDAGFERVIRRWESHGCELLDHLPFVKNAAALRPSPPATWPMHDGRESVATRRASDVIAAKELAAKEAVGRSLLSVEQTLQRYAVIERLASAIPYALMALAAALTIGVGLYARARLLDSGRERRQDVIEHALDEPGAPVTPDGPIH